MEPPKLGVLGWNDQNIHHGTMLYDDLTLVECAVRRKDSAKYGRVM